MIEQHMQGHGIDLRLATSLKEICGDENGKVEAIITEEGERIACQFVGLTAVRPNTFLPQRLTNRTVVDEFPQTNLIDVYAIGDVLNYANLNRIDA